MGKVTLEICVDDADGLDAATAGWADRIELCSALALGGLTPTPGLMARAVDAPIPIYAMVRPRAGDFVFSQAEIDSMLADIELVQSHGLDGVVLGASLPDGRLDAATLEKLAGPSQGLGLTLHRAFDLVPDFAEAIDIAVELGFERILTSGGARTAIEGIEALEKIRALAGDRIAIMPGSGVNAANAQVLMQRLRVSELHASGSAARGPVSGPAVALGFESETRKVTDKVTIMTLKHAMTHP